MAAIALGIIGFGIMGERLLRAAIDHAAAHVRPVGVWDPSPAAAARLAEAAPGVPMLDGAAAVIEACDCLYIAAPPRPAGYAPAAGRRCRGSRRPR
jgi:pyrroline-5-carboxylate reductase